jgi:hypothetical protein
VRPGQRWQARFTTLFNNLLENNPFNQFSVSNSGMQHTGLAMPACYFLQLVSLPLQQVASLPFQPLRKNVRRDLTGENPTLLFIYCTLR